MPIFKKTLIAIALTTITTTSSAQIVVNGTTINTPDGTVVDTGLINDFSGHAAVVSNGGILIADGDITLITGGNAADALYASGTGSRVDFLLGSILTTTGIGSHGVYAQTAASVNLDDANISVSGTSASGISLVSNSQITLNNSTVSVTGAGGKGIAANNSSVIVNNSTLTTTGAYLGSSASALQIANGSRGSMTGSYASTSGASAAAVFVETTNSANTQFDIIDSTLETFGASAALVSSELNGNGSSLATVSGNTQIITHQATAVSARGPGGRIVINPGTSVKTLGANNTAIQAVSGGQVDISGSDVSTTNNGAVAMMANSASSINSQGNNISTVGNNAYAIQANDSGTTVDVTNTNITTSGNNADAVNSNTQAIVTMNQQNVNIHSQNGKTFNALGGTINATLNNSSVINNGILINADTDTTLTNFGIVNLDASDMVLNGDIQAGMGSQANLSLSNTQWNGLARNGGQVTLDNNAIWNMVASSDVAGLTNAGTINFSNPVAGDVLTVHGDYIGNNGNLLFNTELNDDNSITDKMIVEGNTSGNTLVSVTNAGGSGATTLNGIELIQVNGLSDGEFVKNGRIVAGAYDYSLIRGVGTNASNWYLTNAVAPTDPVDPVDPVDPTDPVAPPLMVERPEASSYTANLAAANNMFVTRLHDRLGETQYIDVLTGESKVTSLWLRNEGGHNRSRDTSGQLSTQANRYIVQLGGDIAQWSSNTTDRFHLGVMAGYGNSKSTTVSRISGYNAKGSIDGYSAGVYGTWYANNEDKSGLYVDSWAQYSWFNNTVEGQNLAAEEYKSKGVTASVESGYTFKVGENAAKNATYFIQPKAQVTWMGVKADDHKEANGTNVSGEGDGNIQTRLGVKAFMNGYSDQDKGKDRVFQPFIEANWIHNTKDFGTTMDGVTVKQDGAANVAEVKVGVEGQLNKQLNVWGNVGQQVGNKGYSDTAVMLGIKYNF
ncbi:autotransporter outer membrane beta-barrel domain-containing protein [Yersinia frederiksenii]|uniref:autotransporter outer membrane beta-barrel domain-containing protein n=1 Tax=Yersinia frederiksenii TaxID=29484 RepID=UPI0005E3628A|nr:autotransporter outer membrane beta-barrel domain-containing protein [Yersinia frederiksenii]CFR25838.1 autotransporter protein [Yersinia frederiksenii]